MNSYRNNLLMAICGLAVFFAAVQGHAEDAPGLEIHEWSVWVGEPQGKVINAVADYLSAMPGLVETSRSRRKENAKPAPSPISVMTLYGEPPEFVDIDLKMGQGRPIAQWPKSEGKSNRLRWLDLKVSKSLTTQEGLAAIPESSWFHQARDFGGLYLQFKKGGRIERFLTYDLELQATLPIRLDGGPEQYKIANLGKQKLHNILLIVPGEQGRRVGWLDVAEGGEVAANSQANPEGNPADKKALNNPTPQQGQPNATAASAVKETITDIPLSQPLKEDSEEFQQQTSGELRKRLSTSGLNENEINLILARYAKHFFESEGIQIVFCFSKEALEEITPLTVEPETAKVKRVAIVVARKVDPGLRDDVQKLITALGDSSYEQREKAEKRLKELGRLAIPNLKEALKNKDLEIVMRAERLLLGHKEQLGAESP